LTEFRQAALVYVYDRDRVTSFGARRSLLKKIEEPEAYRLNRPGIPYTDQNEA
jgi:hypothetical protein